MSTVPVSASLPRRLGRALQFALVRVGLGLAGWYAAAHYPAANGPAA